MKHFSMLAVICFILLLSCAAQAAGTYEEGTVYRHHLANGLTVLTTERHGAPLIYHQLTYRVGSRNEHLGITGISHVVEHMMFKGTPLYPRGKASRTISDNAGIFNAFTSNDMTSYFENLPAGRIEVAMNIEADRMENALFDPKEFASEMNVIKQERRMRYESSAQGIIYENLFATAYMSSPNRDPIIGWPLDLNRLTRDEAYRYYKTYYTPNNAFLVLVGDFDTAGIMKTVEKYYGKIPRGPEVKDFTVPEEEQRVRKTITITHNDIPAPILKMAFHVPSYAHQDGPALRAAGDILGSWIRTSRLHKRLVEEKSLASSALCGMPISKDPALFIFTINLMDGADIQKTESLVWEEIAKMQKQKVTARELQKVKNRFLFNEARNYIKNDSLAGLLSMYEAYYGSDAIEKDRARLLAVTEDDIQRVMNRYFSPAKVTAVYGFPGAAGSGRSSGKAPGDTTGPERCYYRTPGEEGGTTAVRPRPLAPILKKWTLRNGITLYTLEDHRAPLFFTGGIFDTGLIEEAEGKAKPGIGQMMAAAMNRGTKSLTYESLTEKMNYAPFTFAVEGSCRNMDFQGSSLARDADEMLATGYEMLTAPAFRVEDVEKVRSLQTDSVRKRLKSTNQRAFHEFFQMIFDGHPYATAEDTEKSLQSITREDLQRLHDRYMTPENLTIVMAGDMSHDEMLKRAENYFGKWKKCTPPAPRAMPAPKALTGKTIRIFPEKESTECTINIGFSPRSDLKECTMEAVDILNTILAASTLTSRMGVEIRDKRGLVYGIRSQAWATSNGMGYWHLQTKTAPKNTEEVITVMFAEIRKMLDGGPTDEEIRSAKERLSGMLPFEMESMEDMTRQIYRMLYWKRPLTWYDGRSDRLMAVTRDDILKEARKYFTLDRYVIVVDGPLDDHALDGLEGRLAK